MTGAGALALVAMVALGGCASGASAPAGVTTAPPSAHSAGPSAGAERLPLGDGHVKQAPAPGEIFACQTVFTSTTAPAVPWIATDGTWNPSSRPSVPGAVVWPQASFTMTLAGATRTLTSTDLPVGAATGVFPVPANQPAAAYDRSTATVVPQAVRMALPANPAPRNTAACLPRGAIGVLTNGVLLYSALDSAGHDAAAHEVHDGCGGRPDASGVYHYDTVGVCNSPVVTLPKTAPVHAALVGYASDGFGIYVEQRADTQPLTNADLDGCHGRTGWVPWDGGLVLMYHYDVTAEYPYTVGCLRGTGSGTAWHNH